LDDGCDESLPNPDLLASQHYRTSQGAGAGRPTILTPPSAKRPTRSATTSSTIRMFSPPQPPPSMAAAPAVREPVASLSTGPALRLDRARGADRELRSRTASRA